MLKRKVRQIGNSLAFGVPNEVFEFLNLDPKVNRYKLCQDETGSVYVVILEKEVTMIDEKKFQKNGTVYTIILPKPLCKMWNIGLGEEFNNEISIYMDDSPLKWKIEAICK